MAPGQPFTVLMEIGFPTATATVVASSAGDGSLYLTSGGGVIGGIGHENVRTAAIEMVNTAATHQQTMTATTEFPYPAEGRVRFYVRTREAVYTAEASKEELSEKKDALWPLFYAGHQVLTQLRTIAPEFGA
jgi:hypothetical protein